ncbi:acetate--CoA ligase family protein [Psychrobacillus soli]|uniref:Acetate--CoA ligase family protein n=1 Tax=Psychrobacillus soli TaxID=1543965 RepID=A0A544TDX2_9BACI|nr:acetate--CoA ligase family protein [Psychrobacillus soli]TQR15596.1 acetate--CoA ligase family protein [Psychrobacillus soli]
MDLQSLLNPQSVALIGASNKPGSLGFEMMEMIAEGTFTGKVYPINPKYDEILGMKCFPDLESIGHQVDLVVLSVAAKRVLAQVENIIENKAKSIVIFANCVLEEDLELEEKVVKKCREANIPVMGHNAMGFYNNDIGLRICGFRAPDANIKGNIALISQSGSVFSTIGHNEPQLKFNLQVATGTGHITSLEDYMKYALEQSSTKVIAVYMESVRKPEEFIEALIMSVTKKIPVVIMKVGKSELGAEFAKSHTGGLAGNDDVFQAVFDHYGVIRVDSLQEFANTLSLFSYFPEIPAGGLVAVVDSGGERNLLADDAEYAELDFATLSDNTMSELSQIQEYGQLAANPLDPWGTGIDFERIFTDSLTIMLMDDNAAIGIISQDLRDGYYLSNGCIDALRKSHENTKKPVAFLTNFSGTRRGEATKLVNNIPAPLLVGTKEGLLAIKHYLYYRDFTFSEGNIQEMDDKSNEIIVKGTLSEIDSLFLLEKFGLVINKPYAVESLADIEVIQHELDYPVVLKTAEDGILHKSNVGGVVLNLQNNEELKDAYEKLSNKLGCRAIIAPMVTFESEFILGMKQDANFGPMVVVGAGGILTELINDKFVILPNASRTEIERNIKALKSYPLLTGFRGKELVPIDTFIDTIQKFCHMVETLSAQLGEVDINPVGVKGDKIIALDALIIGNE